MHFVWHRLFLPLSNHCLREGHAESFGMLKKEGRPRIRRKGCEGGERILEQISGLPSNPWRRTKAIRKRSRGRGKEASERPFSTIGPK